MNGKTFEVESTFHQYVEPRVHNELSPFCTEVSVGVTYLRYYYVALLTVNEIIFYHY